MTAERPPERPNPFVGPKPLQTGEPLFGRDREIRALRNLLVAKRIAVLYSPSGAGKTSLVQAGLIPRMQESDFHVLPVIRVNQPPRGGNGNGPNRYLESALRSLEQGMPEAEQRPDLNGLRFSEFLAQRPKPEDDPVADLLIFDQFEEILTLDPTDGPAKTEFLTQVGEALRVDDRWALFSLREDHLAGLEPFLPLIPTRLATSFRLEFLSREAAVVAIRGTAKEGGIDFREDAANLLVEDLSRVRVQEPDRSIVERTGPDIEPVQLQVVCHRLWNRLPEGTHEIGPEMVAAFGSVGDALAGFYAESVAAVAHKTSVPERDIRAWFDEHLITKQGIRGQMLWEQGARAGLDDRAIRALIDTHLVRADSRRGATWLELAHDRLIDPVRLNNDAWYQINLSALQQQAKLWQDQGRVSGYFLTDEALDQAHQWANEHGDQLTTNEREFLAASLGHRRAQENERRMRDLEAAQQLAQEARARQRAEEVARQEAEQRLVEQAEATGRLRRLLRVAVGLVVLAVLLTGIALRSWSLAERSERDAIAAGVEAERQANIARARQLAADARTQADDRVDLALLLSLEANRLLGTSVESQPDIRGSLLTSVASSRDVTGFLRGHTGSVNSVALSPDGRTLASGSEDGTIILWGLLNRSPLGPPVEAHPGGVLDVAFSPDGQRLASTGRDGRIALWDIADVTAPAEIASLVPGADWVYSVEFSPDGTTLASGDESGSVILWDATTGDQLGEPLRGHTDAVYVVTFNHDGTLLASASKDTTIILWDVAKREPRYDPLAGHEGEVDSLDFSPDGILLASGGRYGNVILWDVATGMPQGNLLSGHKNTVFGVALENAVFGVAFSPDGSTLATASTDEGIILWDVATGEQLGSPLEGYAVANYSLAFSSYVSSGYETWTLASGTADGTVVLWNPYRIPPLTQDLGGHSDLVWSVAFSPDGKTLASGGNGGSVILWDPTDWSEKRRLDQPNGHGVTSLDFGPDGKTLAMASCGRFAEDDSGCTEGEVRLWNVETGEQIGEPLTGHTDWVARVAFSPDGETLATAGYDGQVLLWTRASGQYEATAVGSHEGIAWSVAFSPDGEMLASADDLGWVALWDASSGLPLDEPLLEHDRSVTSLAFSPDGTLLASGTARGEVVLWDVTSRRRLRVLVEHAATFVNGLAFLGRDGRTLASASADGEILLWDLAIQQPIASPLASGTLTELQSIAVSPDGHTLVAGGQGSSFIQAWNLDFDSLPSLACQLIERNLTPEEGTDFLGDSSPPVTCPTGLLEEARRLALVGDREQASHAFEEAVRWVVRTDDANINNAICWEGSIFGFPEPVMPACERAVELAPDDGNVRDSRGVARALTGDFEGAIADFESFVSWAKDAGLAGEFIELRETWIAALRAGHNPIDEEMLRALRAEMPDFAQEEEPVDGLATPVAGVPASARSDPAPTSVPLPNPPVVVPSTDL